jgi:kynurenine formamidase
MQYIDLTHTFNDSMPVYPGDPQPELVKIAQVAKDGFLDFKLSTSMHVGTHMEAPAHMLAGGQLISDYPPQKFFGRGVLIDARGKPLAGPELLAGLQIRKGDMVLVIFGWSSEFGGEEYYKNYPEISEALAKNLAALGVSVLGLDTPSPDRAPYAVHKILFKSDILIVENLTGLEALVGQTNFEVIALPQKLQTDAAPCRVIAKILA